MKTRNQQKRTWGVAKVASQRAPFKHVNKQSACVECSIRLDNHDGDNGGKSEDGDPGLNVKALLRILGPVLTCDWC